MDAAETKKETATAEPPGMSLGTVDTRNSSKKGNCDTKTARHFLRNGSKREIWLLFNFEVFGTADDERSSNKQETSDSSNATHFVPKTWKFELCVILMFQV